MAGEIERAELRASDADRNAYALRLQHAVDEGRLTLGDYDERLQEVYRARTYGELEKVTADLPAAAAPSTVLARKDDTAVDWWREQGQEWRSWAGTSVLLIAIWGITSIAAGGAYFFWPMFPVGIWGAILLAQLVTGKQQDEDD